MLGDRGEFVMFESGFIVRILRVAFVGSICVVLVLIACQVHWCESPLF